MTYIKLEDVKIALYDRFEGVELDYITWKINSLPSINPESMIEEEIKEINKKSELWNFDERNYNRSALIMLNKILQKFKS